MFVCIFTGFGGPKSALRDVLRSPSQPRQGDIGRSLFAQSGVVKLVFEMLWIFESMTIGTA